MPTYYDRVRETTTTTGTGNITLAGAVTGFRTFSSVHGSGQTVHYCIAGGSQWEVGLGTMSGSTTLIRTTVLASSNSNSAVNFSAGTKEVFETLPAALVNKVAVLDVANTFTGYPLTVTTSTDTDVAITTNGIIQGSINANYFMRVSFGSGDGSQMNWNLGSFSQVTFSTLSDYDLTDPGNNYNASSDWYVVPVDGYYRLTTKLRVTDSTGADSYGAGAGDSAADGPHFMWSEPTTAGRNGFINVRTAFFTASTQLFMYTYSQNGVDASDGEFIVEKL